ncbi:MAG: glycosyltransferase [Pyrinomonadaceae bacterium]
MRILKTTQTYYPYLSKGGPPTKVRAIAKELTRRGHQVTVLTALHQDETAVKQRSEVGGQRSEPSEFTQGKWGLEARDEGVDAVYLRTLHNYRATTINPHLISFCARRLRDFDVVHIYGLYDLLGSAVAWFCRRRGIPYVLEPLGMFGPKVRSGRKKNLYRKLIGNALFTGAQVVVATSETERTELIAGGMDDSKILLRRNGINLDDFKTLPMRGALRSKYNVDATRPLVVFVGRLSFIKGLDLLVKAFAQLEADTHLIIAGPDDEDGCAREVKKLIDELKLHDRVTLAGPLYAEEKLQAFVDADFVVLPSRYESFGNVAAEAIACGTPVLVTDQCGIAPLVDGRAGLVVPWVVAGLRDGLQRLIDDRNLLAELRDGCESVARSLSWEEPVAAMERLYQNAKSQEPRAKSQEQSAKRKALSP